MYGSDPRHLGFGTKSGGRRLFADEGVSHPFGADGLTSPDDVADALGAVPEPTQRLRHVVLPQAMRIAVPPLTNRTIAITKGTALGTVVAVTEILGQASSAMSNSYNPSPLMMGAAAYLVLFFPVVLFGRWVETRFAWKR